MKQNPKLFSGVEDNLVDRIDFWLVGMEKIFIALDCPESKRMQFSTYCLMDSTQTWWETIRAVEVLNASLHDWAVFKQLFHRHFISDAQHLWKTQEFEALRQ